MIVESSFPGGLFSRNKGTTSQLSGTDYNSLHKLNTVLSSQRVSSEKGVGRADVTAKAGKYGTL